MINTFLKPDSFKYFIRIKFYSILNMMLCEVCFVIVFYISLMKTFVEKIQTYNKFVYLFRFNIIFIIHR
jgi:hypothetical protein